MVNMHGNTGLLRLFPVEEFSWSVPNVCSIPLRQHLMASWNIDLNHGVMQYSFEKKIYLGNTTSFSDNIVHCMISLN